MNKISWILYLADVVVNFKDFVEIMLAIVGIAFAIMLCCFFLWKVDTTLRRDLSKAIKRITVSLLVILTTLSIIRILTPSKETMLAIAASETTEKVMHSNEGREVLNKLKDKILERMK